NRKKEDTEQRAFVGRWCFNLDSAQQVTISEYTSYYYYQYLSLNGQTLQRDGNGFWINPNSGSLSTMGVKGENVIIAVAGIANDKNPAYDRICIGNLSEQAISCAKKVIDTNKSEEEKGWPLYYLGLYYYESKHEVDGNVLGDAFILHYRNRPKEKDAAKEEKRRKALRTYARRYMSSLPYGEILHFYKKISTALPSWVSEGIYMDGEKFNPGYFNYLLISYARHSNEQTFANTITSLANRILERSKDNDKNYQDMRFHLSYAAGRYLQYCGFFQAALDFFEIIGEENPPKSSKAYKGRTERYYQAKAQLSGNPEALQYLAESETLLARGADDDRAVDSIVSIFRKAGNKLIIDYLSMRSLSVEMLLELSKDQALHKKVIERAQLQFKKRAQHALQKGKLTAISKLIESYATLIDTSTLHIALLDEYMDRCAYNKARYHALHLLESTDTKTATMAAVKLLLIEKALQLSDIEKTPISSRFDKMQCIIAGKSQSVAELQTSMGIKISKRSSIQQPGAVISRMTLGIPHGSDVSGNMTLQARNAFYARQVVEPLFTGDAIVCSTPTYIKSLNVQNRKINWDNEQGAASSPTVGGHTAKQHPATLINGNVALLWSHPNSHQYTIRAYNKHGHIAWDMSDTPDNQKWTPMCSPHSAFGMLFTMVYDNTINDQYNVYLAILNGSNGTIEKTIPINTVFSTIYFERGFAGIHFTHSEDALYGVSGSAVMFKLNRKSLSLDWANGRIYRDIPALHSPPSFIKVYNDVAISHLPSLQEWMAVNKRSGRILWRSINHELYYIHSRNNDQALICSGTDNVIVRLNLQTGRPLWRAKAHGIEITGEGCVVGQQIHVPCKNGYARFSITDGSLISFTKLKQTINKIRVDEHYWYFLSSQDLFVCKHGGAFTPDAFDKPSTLFKESTPTETQILQNVGNLIPVALLPEIGDPNRITEVERCSIPHYFLLHKSGTHNIALFREGHTQKNGTYVPDKTIWIDNRYHHRLSGDKLIYFDSTNIKVVQLPNKELVFEGSLKSINLNRQRIHGVTINQGVMHVIADTSSRHKSIVSIDLKTGNKIKRTDFEAGDLLHYDNDVLIFKKYKQRDIVCYDTASHKEKWQTTIDKKIGDRFYAHLVSSDHLSIGYSNKLQLINRLSGKLSSAFIDDTGDNWVHGFTGDKLFSGSRDVIDTKTGNKIKDVLKVFTAKKIGGAIFYKDKSLTWFDSKGEIALEKPNEMFMYTMEHDRSHKSYLNNNTIYLVVRNFILSYNRTTGKLISARKYGYYVNINTVLNNSVIASTGGHTFVMHDIEQKDAAIKVVQVKNPDKRGWPQDGWTKSQKIGNTFWIPHSAKKSQHKYAMQFGADNSNYYIRLYCSPAHDKGTERIFKSIVSYGHDHNKNFEITWDIDRTPYAIANLTNQKYITSWKRIDRKGNIHCFIVLDHRHIEKNNGRYHENLNINISEYQNGSHQGSYFFAGLSMLEHFGDFGKLSSQQITTINADDNFRFRKNIYDTSNNILHQGTDLAKWVVSYRGLHGFDNSINYLKAMCTRCKDSSISINILACLLNEKLQQWSKNNPDVLEISDGFRSTRKQIISELKDFANKTGVDTHNSEYGLTILCTETYPFEFLDQYIPAMATGGGRDGSHTTYLRSDNSFTPPMTYRPLVSNHFIGSFDVKAPIAMTYMRFARFNNAVGRIEYISPSKHMIFIDKDGTLGHGCKGLANHKGIIQSKDKLQIDTMSYGSKTFHAINYHTAQHYRDIKFDKIDFPKIKEDVLSKKDLLHALNNLPSDSSLGDDIINKLSGQVEEKEYASLWQTLVRQTASNPNNQNATEQALDKIMYYFTRNKQGLSQANQKIKDIMRSHKVARNMQRKVFLKYNNSIIDSERWFNLGSIIKVEGKTLSPLPETVDNIFDQTFSYNDKDYKFITSAKTMPKGQWGCTYRLDNITNHDPALSYHHSSFDLREDKKVFLYFGQMYTGRQAKFTVWIDGKEICSKIIPHSSQYPLVHPLRLKRGTHKILIALDFQRGWDFTFHIGDVSGMPLEEVVYPAAIPID
ncbi:MAG: hypothetical protein HRU15_17740, partial [Planctomycetes bacterium]|nr:hypothetical protein [Planctomycetota bacterium]